MPASLAASAAAAHDPLLAGFASVISSEFSDFGASVQLPTELATRRSCHFDISCYQNYEPVLPIWDLFDRNATLRALAQAGACVVSSIVRPERASAQEVFVSGRTHGVEMLREKEASPLRLPIPASELERYAVEGRLRAHNGDPLRHISFGGSHDCCVLFVPDSLRARQLFLRVNAAFVASPAMHAVADAAIGHFRSVAGTGPRGKPHALALHWRAESDMRSSSHALNLAAYRRGVIRALERAHGAAAPPSANWTDRRSHTHVLEADGTTALATAPRPQPHVLVLGDLGAAATRELGERLGARLHSKATLLGARAVRGTRPPCLAQQYTRPSPPRERCTLLTATCAPCGVLQACSRRTSRRWMTRSGWWITRLESRPSASSARPSRPSR